MCSTSYLVRSSALFINRSSYQDQHTLHRRQTGCTLKNIYSAKPSYTACMFDRWQHGNTPTLRTTKEGGKCYSLLFRISCTSLAPGVPTAPHSPRVRPPMFLPYVCVRRKMREHLERYEYLIVSLWGSGRKYREYLSSYVAYSVNIRFHTEIIFPAKVMLYIFKI